MKNVMAIAGAVVSLFQSRPRATSATGRKPAFTTRGRAGPLTNLRSLGILVSVLASTQVLASIYEPAPASTITSSSITVSWMPAADVMEYYLGVGTSANAVESGVWGDISFQAVGQKTSVDVPGIPLDGNAVHMRLWTRTTSGWSIQDHVFGTAVGVEDCPASIISPLPSNPLSSGSVLEWSGVGTSEYILAVGSSYKVISEAPWADLYYYRGEDTSAMLEHIPGDGTPVHVRLWSRILERWHYQDYLYDTAHVIPAEITYPASGADLEKHAQRVKWSESASATEYVLAVASDPTLLEVPEQADYFLDTDITDNEVVVTGIPLDGGAVYMRLWSLINGQWFFSDSSFSSSYSGAEPDLVAECEERLWKKSEFWALGRNRDLLWRAPADGTWERGAIVLLHGGGGSNDNWCSDTPVTHELFEFAEAALADGFAVFALNSDGYSDQWGQYCGNRFDALTPPEDNGDIAYIRKFLDSKIYRFRPAGSNEEVFMTGISTGGFMTLRAATHFDGQVSAFAAVSSGDPYGTFINCLETPGQELRPGYYADKETMLPINGAGACESDVYANAMDWETQNPQNRPPFRLLHHRNDGAVDLSCMEKAEQQLISHGYQNRGRFVLGGDVSRGQEAHVWQPEYSQEILNFFIEVSEEPAEQPAIKSSPDAPVYKSPKPRWSKNSSASGRQ